MPTIKTNFTIDQALAIEWEVLPELLKEWQEEKWIKERLRESVQRSFALLDNPDFGQQFYKGCQVAGTQATDYDYQCWELSDGGKIITSIRFLGGDLSKPFVELVCRNFHVQSLKYLQSLANEVYEHHKIFKPKHLRLFDGKGIFPDTKEGIEYDLHYVAAPIEAIRQLPVPERYEEVQLTSPDSMDVLYERYTKIFNQLLAEKPEYEQMIGLESKEDLAKLLAEKTLFSIEIDGQWAGLIAAERRQEQYLRGFCVIEELLEQSWRGQGFGAALQRHMIERLPVQANDLIYGTIDDKNVPSLKTAFRVGRKSIGKYVFCKMK